MTHPYGMNFTWSADRIAVLTVLFNEGHSFAIIAAELSGRFAPLTRNAALGKCHRLGLKRACRERARSTPYRPAAPRKPRAAVERVKSIRSPQIAPMAPVEPTGTNRCDLLALTNTSCRWPEGDAAPFLFCGEPEADLIAGVAYCAWHARMAFRRPGEREAA